MLQIPDELYASKQAANCISELPTMYTKRHNESMPMSKYIDEFPQCLPARKYSYCPFEKKWTNSHKSQLYDSGFALHAGRESMRHLRRMRVAEPHWFSGTGRAGGAVVTRTA